MVRINKSITMESELAQWMEEFGKSQGKNFTATVEKACKEFKAIQNGDNKEALKLRAIRLMKERDDLESELDNITKKIENLVVSEVSGLEKEAKSSKEILESNEKSLKEREKEIIKQVESLEGLEKLNEHLKEKGKDYDYTVFEDMIDELREKNPTKIKFIDGYALNLYAKQKTDKTTLTGFVTSFLKPTPKPERIDKKSIDSLDKIDKIIQVLQKAKQEGNILQQEDYDKAYEVLCDGNPTCIIDYEELKQFLDDQFKKVEVEK